MYAVSLPLTVTPSLSPYHENLDGMTSMQARPVLAKNFTYRKDGGNVKKSD